MVDVKKLDRNLNHILAWTNGNPSCAIGAVSVQLWDTIKLFDKSLPLTSDLKRLPCLVGFWADWELGTGWAQAMVASGVSHMVMQVEIYEHSVESRELDKLIYTCNIYLFQTGGAPGPIYAITPPFPLDGAVLLPHEIKIYVNLGFNVAVAGVDYPASEIRVNEFFEIDWVEVSKAEMTDYLLEHAYADI